LVPCGLGKVFLYVQIPQVFVFSTAKPDSPCYINDLALVHLLFRRPVFFIVGFFILTMSSVPEEGIAPGGLLPLFDEFSRIIFHVIDRCTGVPIDFPENMSPQRREAILGEIQELSTPPSEGSPSRGDVSAHEEPKAPIQRGSPLPKVSRSIKCVLRSCFQIPLTPTSQPHDVGGAREDVATPLALAKSPPMPEASTTAEQVSAGIAATMPPASLRVGLFECL